MCRSCSLLIRKIVKVDFSLYVFQRRMSTWRGLFTFCLGSGFASVFSGKSSLYEWRHLAIQSWWRQEISKGKKGSLPFDLRRSKIPLRNLLTLSQVTLTFETKVAARHSRSISTILRTIMDCKQCYVAFFSLGKLLTLSIRPYWV